MKSPAHALAILTLLASATARSAPPVEAPNQASSDGPRALIAAHFAPTIFQETKDDRDLLTAFNFDGDWDGANNAANLKKFPARAVVYDTVAETATHFLVTYVIYHPVDAKWGSGHDHDTEHVTVVIRKDGSAWGHLEAMETRFHKVMYQYAAPGIAIGTGADNVDGTIHLGGDGRPEVYAQRVGHGLCGGYAPTSWLDTLALRCNHREEPHISRHGVVYRYTGTASVPRSLDDRDVGYALVEIGDTLWAHARDGGTFTSSMDFDGERCASFACPRGIGRQLSARPGHNSTGMPWEEGGGRGVKGRGSAFFDPAFTLAHRLRFPAPFSTDYLFNPYLGIGSFTTGPALASRSLPRRLPADRGIADRITTDRFPARHLR